MEPENHKGEDPDGSQPRDLGPTATAVSSTETEEEERGGVESEDKVYLSGCGYTRRSSYRLSSCPIVN